MGVYGCFIKPFMPSGLFYLFLWAGPFSVEGLYALHLLLLFNLKCHVLNTNILNPDETPRSHLGLHCLAMSFFVWIEAHIG